MRMNGMTGSWVEQRKNEIEEILRAFSTRVSLRDMVVNNDVSVYLNKTKEEMEKMSQVECAEVATLLNEAATFTQLQLNNEQGRCRWAEETITRLIASRISQYGDKYTPFDYRRAMAIQDNEATVSLEKIRINSQLCVDSMAYVPTQMRHVATSYAELSNAKRYKRETS